MVGSAPAPLARGVILRRFVHLLLGAVVALPYVALVALFVVAIGSGGLDLFATIVLGVVAVAIGVGVPLAPGVRALEIAAARALLGVDVPDPGPVESWPARFRAAAWLVVVTVSGALIVLATLVVVPSTLGLLVAPWVPLRGVPTGWAAAWAPPAGILLVLALLALVHLTGAGLARLAPGFLGPTRAEQLERELAATRADADALAHRNRLARELHDSVGHALTVTTVQAGAAARVLARLPIAPRTLRP